jgi:hypothetical protein
MLTKFRVYRLHNIIYLYTHVVALGGAMAPAGPPWLRHYLTFPRHIRTSAPMTRVLRRNFGLLFFSYLELV